MSEYAGGCYICWGVADEDTKMCHRCIEAVGLPPGDIEKFSFCWVDHAWEEIPENVYIVCFECSHVWTKESLEAAYERITEEMGEKRHKDATEIFFCQACIHDF